MQINYKLNSKPYDYLHKYWQFYTKMHAYRFSHRSFWIFRYFELRFALSVISPGSSKKPDSTVYQTPDWVFHHISSTRRKLKIPRLDWPFQGESWPIVRGFVWLPYGAVSCLCSQQELSYRRPGLCWPNIGLSAWHPVHTPCGMLFACQFSGE